jgi:dTMP kinase
VVSDRFASSTLAYQGGGGGVPIEQIQQIAQIAVGATWPHLTVVFDLDTDEAMARINPLYSSKPRSTVAGASDAGGAGAAGGEESPGGPRRKRGNENQNALFSEDIVKDRIEQRARDYFQRVRANYLWQAGQWPDRYRIVDASKSIPQVEKQVMRTIMEFFRPAS